MPQRDSRLSGSVQGPNRVSCTEATVHYHSPDHSRLDRHHSFSNGDLEGSKVRSGVLSGQVQYSPY